MFNSNFTSTVVFSSELIRTGLFVAFHVYDLQSNTAHSQENGTLMLNYVHEVTTARSVETAFSSDNLTTNVYVLRH